MNQPVWQVKYDCKMNWLPDQDSNLDSTDSESDVLASYTIGQ